MIPSWASGQPGAVGSGHTVVLQNGSTGTGSGPLSGQRLRRQRGELGRCWLSGTKKPLQPCTHHCVPRPSAPKQAELGDPRTLQMERGTWRVKLGWDK